MNTLFRAPLMLLTDNALLGPVNMMNSYSRTNIGRIARGQYPLLEQGLICLDIGWNLARGRLSIT